MYLNSRIKFFSQFSSSMNFLMIWFTCLLYFIPPLLTKAAIFLTISCCVFHNSINPLTPKSDRNVISLNHTFRSRQSRRWSPTNEAWIVQQIFPRLHLGRCIENSVKDMHTVVRVKMVNLIRGGIISYYDNFVLSSSACRRINTVDSYVCKRLQWSFHFLRC